MFDMYYGYYQCVIDLLSSCLLSVSWLCQPVVNMLSTGYQHVVVHRKINFILKNNILSNERMSKDFFLTNL
jgi:hypothetical protein